MTRRRSLADFGMPVGYLDRQVMLWRRHWEQVRTRDLPDIDRLHEVLADGFPGRAMVGSVTETFASTM